jgi:uncharacterized membrane protein YdjX (TVP38/TMEM64 family)
VSKKKSRLAQIKWISIVLIVLSVFVIMAQLPMRKMMEPIHGFIRGMGAPGMAAYGALYVVATILLVPGSVLTMAAGMIFGLLWGTITALFASTAGAALAFLIARYVARDRVARMADRHPNFGAVDRAVSEGGWKIVGLMRLFPVIPFNLQNYLYGLTGIRFWTCVLTSWVAMLPGTFIFVYLGYLARAGVETAADGEGAGVWMWAARIAGFAATAAVTLYVTKLAREAIKKQTPIEKTPEPGETDETTAAAEREPRWPAVVAAAFAVVFVVFAAYAAVNPDMIRQPALRAFSAGHAQEGD